MEFVPDHMMDRLCYYCKVEAGLINPTESPRGGYRQPSSNASPGHATRHPSGGMPTAPGTSGKPDFVTLGKSLLETIQKIAVEAGQQQEKNKGEIKKGNKEQNANTPNTNIKTLIFWTIIFILFIYFRSCAH